MAAILRDHYTAAPLTCKHRSLRARRQEELLQRRLRRVEAACACAVSTIRLWESLGGTVEREANAQKKKETKAIAQVSCRPVSLLRCADMHITADSALRPTDLRLHSQQLYSTKSSAPNQANYTTNHEAGVVGGCKSWKLSCLWSSRICPFPGGRGAMFPLVSQCRQIPFPT